MVQWQGRARELGERGAGRNRGANPWLVQQAPGKTVTQTLLQRNPLCQCTKKSVTSSQRNPVKSVQPVVAIWVHCPPGLLPPRHKVCSC